MLKCHLALILPACYLCYACSGDLSKATKEQRDLVLDAAWEACEMLKAAHIPVDDKENTDCYRAGTPGRRKMDAMVLALCKTPLGRLCISDHAMHAVAEMQYLDEAFEGLRTRTSVRMTAWDTLRSQMPRGTSCGKRRRKQSDKCMEKEADASLPLFVFIQPEIFQLFLQLFRIPQILQMPPMLREEPGVLALGKAVVEEQHHALIFLRPDDPPGGLQDFVHPGQR